MHPSVFLLLSASPQQAPLRLPVAELHERVAELAGRSGDAGRALQGGPRPDEGGPLCGDGPPRRESLSKRSARSAVPAGILGSCSGFARCQVPLPSPVESVSRYDSAALRQVAPRTCDSQAASELAHFVRHDAAPLPPVVSRHAVPPSFFPPLLSCAPPGASARLKTSSAIGCDFARGFCSFSIGSRRASSSQNGSLIDGHQTSFCPDGQYPMCDCLMSGYPLGQYPRSACSTGQHPVDDRQTNGRPTGQCLVDAGLMDGEATDRLLTDDCLTNGYPTGQPVMDDGSRNGYSGEQCLMDDSGTRCSRSGRGPADD
jgi:hypothetical protein